ncbi:ATP-dependent protease [Candidatus Bathyarchaeota archaeon RBG_16_57_9]|nr:MAG: ATP-dependent protease [Candidatus Bathyarchaeota archaeon RBG_16_57_9]
MVQKLDYTLARRRCPRDFITCESTLDLDPLVEIIGQERAVKALQFGLDIKEEGFNIYVAGMAGTGKKTAIMTFLEQRAKGMPPPPDWCYVYNFEEEDKPNALRLPTGMGVQFRDDVAKYVEDLKKALTAAFESEDYATRREEVTKRYDEKKQELMKTLNKKASDAGFVLQRTEIGLLIIPVINGQMINEQQIGILPQSVRDEIQARRKKLQDELRSAFRQFRDIDRETETNVESFNREVAEYAMEHLMQRLRDKYGQVTECNDYLDALRKDVLENLGAILGAQKQQESQLPFFMGQAPDPTLRYRVNLVVDNSKQEGAPVIMEMNPTYSHLFGATEKEARFGTLVTDYTMIRAGSAHKANGGYLVIPVEELARNPGSYETLKRTITNRKLEIEELAERLGYITTKSLRPEPIPFDAKVIIVGESRIYYLLYQLDPEFKKNFKVKAEFDNTMERDESKVRQYAQFMCTLCNKEGLKHLDSTGIAAVVEYSSRLAADQEKLSTQFAEVSDIIREADFYSKQDGSKFITEEQVRQAVEAKVYRSNLIEEKIEEMIERGSLLVDTAGEKVGQVNGLAVLGTGDYMFGKPSRITASIGAGKEGIIDIEREAEMGGPTHTKGVHILTGFLTDRYARSHPLGLAARLTFEQSYSGVDGDSASSTETYAMMSALSGIPIKQSLAVTGSVNQKGEVQAIGGVNEKIEGYYELCKYRGLDGSHGVVIPESNVKNLMLKEEVVEAIKDGKFSVYPVKTIDEGIEALTGVPAGKMNEDGSWPEGTINSLAQKKLDELAKIAKEYVK